MGAKQTTAEMNLAAQIAILSDHISVAVESKLREQGHSLSTFQLLSTIQSSEANITQAELAQRIGITAASLCESLKNASNKGLVEQKLSETDRRAKRVSLTPKGRKLIEKTLGELDSVNRQMLQGLTPKQQSDMVSLLTKCIDSLAKGRR